MSSDFTTAGQGLKTVFIGELLCVLFFIPLAGPFLALAGLIVTLVGLNASGRAHEGYRTAFTLSIVSIVLSVLTLFIGFLSIIVSILDVAIVYYVCTTSAGLLSQKGDAYQAAKGATVWKIYAGCLVVSIICSILAIVPLINVFAAIASVITAIVQLVGMILYVVFLYKAQESLLA